MLYAVIITVGGVLGIVALVVLWALHRFPGQYFNSNGVHLFYRIEGSGAPVVLIHGYGANAELNWRCPGVVRALRKHYQVILVDMRGHGLSDKPMDPNQYGMEMVHDVVRLLDHLGIPKAHAVGYSMGGFITLKLITAYPDRLLSAAPCAAGWEAPDGQNLQILGSLTESLERGEGFGPLTRALEPGRRQPALWKIKLIDFAMGSVNDIHAMAAIMKRFSDLAVTEDELRANPVPTLSIVGTKDPLGVGVKAMDGVMACHRAAYIPNGDHFTTIFKKEYMTNLRAFLAENTPEEWRARS